MTRWVSRELREEEEGLSRTASDFGDVASVGSLEDAESRDRSELAELVRQQRDETFSEVCGGGKIRQLYFIKALDDKQHSPTENALNQLADSSLFLLSPRSMTQECSPVRSLVVCLIYRGTYPARFQNLKSRGVTPYEVPR